MTLCTTCYQTYHFDRQHLCLACDSSNLTVPVHKDLLDVVKRFAELGIRVVNANYTTYDISEPFEGLSSHITIELGEHYPEEMLGSFPPPWLRYEYRKVWMSQISEQTYTGLSCEEYHPVAEMDNESIEFSKMVSITNIESWLADRDPAGFYSVYKLAGFLL